MDYDRGAPDLGLASTLDEILGEADPLGAWDADLRSQAPQKTPGDALWAGQTRRVSPDEQTNRTLFPERVIDDDSEGEATRGPDPPLANLSQLQAWAADAARRLQAAAARSEADRLKILALEAAASRPKKSDDEQAAWRLERATLETLAKARERAHAEKVKEMLADSLKAQSALEAAKDEVIESLTTELEETKRELRTETQKGCELEAAVDARNARIDELKDEKASLQKANASLEAKLATRKQRDGTPTKARSTSAKTSTTKRRTPSSPTSRRRSPRRRKATTTTSSRATWWPPRPRRTRSRARTRATNAARTSSSARG